MNVTYYKKYFVDLPTGITESNVDNWDYYITERTTRDQQGLMDLAVKAVNKNSTDETTTLEFKIRSVTGAIAELLFYHENVGEYQKKCGYYVIGYNTIQHYFTKHHNRGTNPVGFSFVHFKWPDDSDNLIRK